MPEAPPPDERLPVAIVGAGAVGTALAKRLRAAGYSIAAVLSRTPDPAEALAAEVEAPVAASRLAALPAQAHLVLLCVPDEQVRPAAQALAEACAGHPWTRSLAAHTSGALPADALDPLSALGATTFGFHPLQAISEGATGDVFDGAFVGLDGPPEALAAGRALAQALGARSLVLSPEAKARYHLAAAMASNFLVTLAALAGDVLDEALAESPGTGSSHSNSRGIDRADGADALLPLLEGTLRNLKSAPPEAALTGPIARGDTQTVAAHVEALHTHHPGLTPAYAALATETVRLASRAGRLASPQADALLDVLDDSLDQEATGEE